MEYRAQSLKLFFGKIIVIHARLPEAVQTEIGNLRRTEYQRLVPERVDAVNEPAFFTHLSKEAGIVIPHASRFPNADEVFAINLLEKGFHRLQRCLGGSKARRGLKEENRGA